MTSQKSLENPFQELEGVKSLFPFLWNLETENRTEKAEPEAIVGYLVAWKPRSGVSESRST